MSYENILTAIHGKGDGEGARRTALITLNRPKQLNALNDALMDELGAALRGFDADPGIGCIVITGSEKAFAAGADIGAMATKSFAQAYGEDFITRNWETIRQVGKRVIGAVAGFALGGGCELAMMCDFIIAADSAKFGQPEINLGVVAGIGGTQRLTRFVGKSKAMDMHLTGRFMGAAEAERSGLVSRVVAAKKLMEEALSAAEKIAEKSILTSMVVKEAVNRSYETTLREGLLFERRVFNALFATEDQKEGMAAFLEKRQPQFRDR